MHYLGWPVIASVVCLAAMGCADKSQQNANKGTALTAAGFKVVPASTPERQAALRQLPPQKFVRQLRGGKVVFIYADPANCNCLYAGGVTAYGAYRARERQDEQATTAMDSWDWSLGPFGYPSGWPDD